MEHRAYEIFDVSSSGSDSEYELVNDEDVMVPICNKDTTSEAGSSGSTDSLEDSVVDLALGVRGSLVADVLNEVDKIDREADQDDDTVHSQLSNTSLESTAKRSSSGGDTEPIEPDFVTMQSFLLKFGAWAAFELLLLSIARYPHSR